MPFRAKVAFTIFAYIEYHLKRAREWIDKKLANGSFSLCEVRTKRLASEEVEASTFGSDFAALKASVKII